MPQYPNIVSTRSKPKVVVSGYYGFNNLGDELILHVLIQQLKQRELDITVLSNDPEHTERQYGVRAIHRMSPVQIIDTLANANLLISGGGGLFQDVTGPLNTVYYGGLIYLAKFFEVPVCFWGQGLGPLNKPLSRFITQQALHCASMITVRDEPSAQLVTELIQKRPRLAVDPVWLLDLPSRKANSNQDPDTPWLIGISLRSWPDLTPDRLQSFAKFLGRLAEQSTRPVQFLLLPFQGAEDHKILTDLSRLLLLLNAGSWRMVAEEQVLETIPECHLLFGMRFHSLVLGILSDVAVYGLIYDPKVRHLVNTLGLQGTDISMLDSLDATQVQEYFNQYPAVDLDHLRKSAYQNFEALDELLAQQNFSELVQS